MRALLALLTAGSLLGPAGLAEDPAAPAQDPAPAAAPDWVGRWSATDGSGVVLLLEPERAGWWQEERASFSRLRREEDGLALESWGRLTPLELELTEGRLHVQRGDQRVVLERVEEIPDGLAVLPYDWPEAVEVDEAVVAAVQEDLRARHAEDQRVRNGAYATDFSEESRQEMMRVDADNTEFLLGLVEELGWIDGARFGSEAAMTAFLLVQHSGDFRFMRSALPYVEADQRAGRVDGQAYALLFDRLQLNLGYLQRYGSQCGTTASGETVLLPCEDLERVDERRAALGMQPVADYLARFPVPQPMRTLDAALAQPEREG